MKATNQVTFEDVLAYCSTNGLKVCSLSDRTVFEVVEHSDLIEGRGSPVYHGRFMTKDLAREFSKGKGVMGFEADVVERKVTMVTFLGPLNDNHKDTNTYFCLGEQVNVLELSEKAHCDAVWAVVNKLTINDVNLLKSQGFRLPGAPKVSK